MPRDRTPGAVDAPPVAAIDPAQQRLGEAVVPKLISSKYMKVCSDPAARSLEEWILPPMQVLPESLEGHPCCVMEDFISTWKDPIEVAIGVGDARQRIRLPESLPSITVAGLQNFFGMQPDEYRVPVPDYMRLLNAFGLGADFYGVTGEQIATLKARTHKLVPERAAYMVKNDHLYRLTEELEGLFKRDTLGNVAKPSNRFPLQKSKCVRVFIESANDIMALDRSEHKKGTRFDIRLNESLDRLLRI